MSASSTTGYPTVWEARTDHYIVPVRVSAQLLIAAAADGLTWGGRDTRITGMQQRSDGSYELQLVEVEPDPNVAAALQDALHILDLLDAGAAPTYARRQLVKNEIRVALDALNPPTA